MSSIDKENTLQSESIESGAKSANISTDFDAKRSPFLNPKISKQSDKFEQYLQHEHPANNDKTHQPTFLDSVISRFPIINVFSNYNKNALLSDVSAGFTIGVQLLPKGMAYAMMAGLNKSNGVIVAMMSTLLYPLCGSTPYLCTGPDPVICLLISKVIAQLSFSEDDFKTLKDECGDHCPDALKEEWVSEKSSAIGLVTMFVVLFQILGAIINFGFISNFITKPIIDSFVCSAALVILCKQLHYCLNMHSITAQGTFARNVIEIFHDVPDFFTNFTVNHLIVVLLSLVTLVVLFSLHFWSHSKTPYGRKFAAHIPAVLLVVILGIVFTITAESMGKKHWFGDQHPLVALVGEFTVTFSLGFKWPGVKLVKGFPVFRFQHLPQGIVITLWDVMNHAFVIAIASYFCSMIVSRKLAVRKGFSVEPNQELLGLGVANSGCLLFGAFPCGGILATSIAVVNTSVKTRIWSIFCAIIVILLSQIPICTVLLAKLPKAVLSAVVIETVIPLVSFGAVSQIGNVLALDLLQYVTTMVVCFLYGIETGIVAGMIVAVFELVYRGTRNRVSELGRLPEQSQFRRITTHPDALVVDRVLICRVHDSLFFTNWYPVEQAIQTLIHNHENRCGDKDHLIAVVINLISCGNIDTTAAFGLLSFSQKNAKKGVAVRISALTDSVYNKLKAVGMYTIHDCGVKYKFYKTDHGAVVDIIKYHRAIHFSGSLHMSEAVSPDTTQSH